jgi:hypothetical protein
LYANDLRRRIGFLAKVQDLCVIRKKTKNHVAYLFLPEGVGSNGTESDLFTMSKYPALERLRILKQSQTCSLVRRMWCSYR